MADDNDKKRPRGWIRKNRPIPNIVWRIDGFASRSKLPYVALLDKYLRYSVDSQYDSVLVEMLRCLYAICCRSFVWGMYKRGLIEICGNRVST
jgi:hypothetical protein